jgi:hypothetical protein
MRLRIAETGRKFAGLCQTKKTKMKKRNLVPAVWLLAVLLIPLWRGIAKWQDVKTECRNLQEPSDMNIVLVLEDYHFSRLDVFDKPNLIDFYKSGLRRMR